MCIFSMLGALMFCSKIIMEVLPNIHLLGMLTVVYTVVFRTKALIPIYVYVVVNGLYAGFSAWWVPYLYIWTVLWAVVMLIPRRLPKKLLAVIYAAVCCLHGLTFGILYAPVQALMYGFDLEQTLAWIAAGFTFDILHGHLLPQVLALQDSWGAGRGGKGLRTPQRQDRHAHIHSREPWKRPMQWRVPRPGNPSR